MIIESGKLGITLNELKIALYKYLLCYTNKIIVRDTVITDDECSQMMRELSTK